MALDAYIKWSKYWINCSFVRHIDNYINIYTNLIIVLKNVNQGF